MSSPSSTGVTAVTSVLVSVVSVSVPVVDDVDASVVDVVRLVDVVPSGPDVVDVVPSSAVGPSLAGASSSSSPSSWVVLPASPSSSDVPVSDVSVGTDGVFDVQPRGLTTRSEATTA